MMITRIVFSVLCLALVFSSSLVFGQLARKTQEVWPSIDVYYRINEKFRLYTTAGGTKKDSSNYTDGSLGVFLDFFSFPVLAKRREAHLEELPGKYFRLRTGYQYTATPPNSEDPFQESLFVAQADWRYSLPYSVLFTFKNRFDFRFKGDDFSTRYRPRIHLEKDLHTDYLFFTASCFLEYYANFGQSDLNRFRFQLGLEFKVTKHINYETYWNHQFDHQPSIDAVDAFGMSLKFYLMSKNMKSALEKGQSK